MIAQEQTVLLPARATAFTEICAACEEDAAGQARFVRATVSGSLRLDAERGWATCPRGHTVRVQRDPPAAA